MKENKYDIIIVPIRSIDLETAGEFFNADSDHSKRFDKMIGLGYKVHSFQVVNSEYHFLFEK